MRNASLDEVGRQVFAEIAPFITECLSRWFPPGPYRAALRNPGGAHEDYDQKR